MTIQQRLFDLLKEKHISQVELARNTGIPTSTISSWKSNKSDPPIDKLSDIADFLGVSVNYLLGKSEEMQDLELSDINFFNNELVTQSYLGLSEKQKLRVQVYILELAEGKDGNEE